MPHLCTTSPRGEPRQDSKNWPGAKRPTRIWLARLPAWPPRPRSPTRWQRRTTAVVWTRSVLNRDPCQEEQAAHCREDRKLPTLHPWIESSLKCGLRIKPALMDYSAKERRLAILGGWQSGVAFFTSGRRPSRRLSLPEVLKREAGSRQPRARLALCSSKEGIPRRGLASISMSAQDHGEVVPGPWCLPLLCLGN